MQKKTSSHHSNIPTFRNFTTPFVPRQRGINSGFKKTLIVKLKIKFLINECILTSEIDIRLPRSFSVSGLIDIRYSKITTFIQSQHQPNVPFEAQPSLEIAGCSFPLSFFCNAVKEKLQGGALCFCLSDET